MRILANVLTNMIDEVPKGFDELQESLIELRDSASYAAPEMQRFWWGQAGETLGNHFPDPNNLKEWEQKLVNIFMDVKV